MKVLLIQPPIEDFFFTPQRAYPLAVLSLASTLQQQGKGLCVSILDCFEGSCKQSVIIPKHLAYLKKYYQPNGSPFCLFAHYYHFGISYDRIEQRIIEYAPDVVGISAGFTPYYESSLHVARLVKKVDTRIRVVIGGRAASVQPEFFLRHDSVDFVLRGEAEHTFLSLCNDLQHDREPRGQGICHTYGKRLRIAPDKAIIGNLDELALLDRTLIKYTDYRYNGDISTSLLASRGCPMACAFCAIDEPFRVRSAENILREIKQCFDLGIRHYNFEDDNILLHPHLQQIIEGIIDIGKKRTRLSFMNGLMTPGLTVPMLDLLRKAGLTHVDLSLVSGNPRLRKTLNRFDELRQMKQVTRCLKKHHIPATVHCIVGFPGQSMRDGIEDIKRLAAEPVLLGPSIFYPVIDSKLFRQYSLWSRLNPALLRSSAACVDRDMPRDHIIALVYFARIVNFIKRCCEIPLRRRQIRALFLQKKRIPLPADNKHTASSHDRYGLGIYLLREMFDNHVLYRATTTQVDDHIQYTLTPELFISPDMIALFLKDLTVQSLRGYSVSVLSNKPSPQPAAKAAA